MIDNADFNITEIKKILDYQPSGMSEDDIKNPINEFIYFFHDYELHESRRKIWELYEGWMHLEAECPQGESMLEKLFFCRKLIEFLNCAFVVSKQIK